LQLPAERIPESIAQQGLAVRVSKRGIWLEAGSDARWKDQLVRLLQWLGAPA
jgi:hypothetical protein